jgi:hypothetical protein
MICRRRAPLSLAAACATALTVTGLVTGVSSAHPDHGTGGREDFPGEGVADGLYKQHDGDEGHLPPVQENVTLVGKAEVTNPAGSGNTGRVADVSAFGDYAYLNAFRSPDCEQTGVHVVDIHDPAHPFEVPDAFIPTSAGSYVGEGIQILHVDSAYFTGELLAHQNETCPGVTPAPPNLGGISLWDVSDPLNPEPVTLHTGDFTNPLGGTDPAPNQTHSMRMWTSDFDGRTYVVLVDDEEGTDVDIMDITDPFNPVMVNDELDLDEVFGVDQESPTNLTSVFSHDMMVTKIGQRYVMNMNYWDGGYVLLDVTDPTDVSLIAESDYAALDEERLARGHSISPEGNAHQSELSPNKRFLLATDEDFNPFRVTAVIDTGTYAGTEYIATQASDATPIDENTTISGPTTFVGLACTASPPPAGSGTALVERGVCPFQEKLDNIIAAGYTAGIVFQNVRPDCQSRVTMLAAGDIPFVFVTRLNGLQLLNVAGVTDANACTTATPAAPAAGESTTIQAVFDGWGFVRLFGTSIPTKRGATGSISDIDTYAVPESQDPAYATGFGDLSVHEVAMDPDNSNIAYISYYAAGYRVVNYGKKGIREIGAFIDDGGNNFWGVEVWRDETGHKYVLASDRDFGLYIFEANG